VIGEATFEAISPALGGGGKGATAGFGCPYIPPPLKGGDIRLGVAFGKGAFTDAGPGVLRLDSEGGLAKVSGKSFQLAPLFAFGGTGGPDDTPEPARGGGASAAG